MLKISSIEAISKDTYSFKKCSVIFKDNICDFITAEIFDDKPDVISVEFGDNYNINDFINKDLKSTFKTFLTKNGLKVNYECTLDNIFYYSWEQLYFPDQYIDIVSINSKNYIDFHFCLPNECFDGWNQIYSPKYSLNLISELIKNEKLITFISEIEGNDSISFIIRNSFKSSEKIYSALVKSYSNISAIDKKIRLKFESMKEFRWDSEFEQEESKFCTQVLVPLLQRMKYSNVRYIHGIDEYRRDIIFDELNRFHKKIVFGLQAKAGDVSGEANSLLDKIIGQLEDAFTLPVAQIGSENVDRINFMIIAISGVFKKNAIVKINSKLNKAYQKNVFFWDKPKILELIEEYWKSNSQNS